MEVTQAAQSTPTYTFPDGLVVTGPWLNDKKPGKAHNRIFDGATPGIQWTLRIDRKGKPRPNSHFKVSNETAVALPTHKEAREVSAKKEISEWQKRVAARAVEVNAEKPPYEVAGQGGTVWHITQPAATSTFAVQSLIGARIMGDNANADVSDEEIKVLSGAALLYLFTVNGKDDQKLLFSDIDDALAFMDASETGLDAIRILASINKRYADFLGELSLIG